MNLKRWTLFVGMICFFVLPSSVFAATVNGITVNKKVGTLAQGYNVEFFTNFSLSTTWGTITGHVGEFVANESGSSTVNDGWVPISGITGLKTISFVVGTATGIGTGTLRVEGMTGTSTHSQAWMVSSDYTFTGTGTFGFPVTEYLTEIRVLYNIDTIGTDSISVYGDFLGQTENL